MSIALSFIPVAMRLPLKFGAETIHSIQVAHAELEAYGATGRGETPLSVAWAWPAELPFAHRETAMMDFCRLLAENYPTPQDGDPMTVGYRFLEDDLPALLAGFNATQDAPMPYLAALICASAFDLALHDAFGMALQRPTYSTYNKDYMRHDLEWFFQDGAFAGKYPQDFFVANPPATLPVWHLVGGKDLLRESERTGAEPDDGYPVSLERWIARDGLKCLKIKLTGRDEAADYARLVAVGQIALEHQVEALSPDFNCLVRDPAYVIRVLDRLATEQPDIHQLLLYVEQPFPYDLETNRIDVHEVARRKPLVMDESAHDWRLVRLGHQLGWNGVALKVCKTQTGALLSACWAKAHGMALMVQDLTNPRLATIPHALLAAHVGTIKGVECNAPQFYPTASLDFEKVHPGLYERRNGVVKLGTTLTAPGFGY